MPHFHYEAIICIQRTKWYMALIVLCHIPTPESRFRTGSKYHQTARADETLLHIHVRSARETKILPHFKNFL